MDVTQRGRYSVAVVRNDYTTNNVLSSAYTQLVAATALQAQRAMIFDSSGAALKIAFGSVGNEVDQFFIPPGGYPEPIEVFIPKGTRVSIRSVDTATVNTGQLLMTLLT